MAAYSQADDIEQLSRGFAQLVRLALPYRSTPQLGLAAKAAGISVNQCRMFLDGLYTPPARQGVALCLALLEQVRAGNAGYLTEIRKGHAGGGLLGGASTREGVAKAAKTIEDDFPSWKVTAGALETIDAGKPNVVWSAKRTGEPSWPDVAARSEHELAAKLAAVERSMKADADEMERYRDGRGITRRRTA